MIHETKSASECDGRDDIQRQILHLSSKINRADLRVCGQVFRLNQSNEVGYLGIDRLVQPFDSFSRVLGMSISI